jgi:hypothetical protein
MWKIFINYFYSAKKFIFKKLVILTDIHSWIPECFLVDSDCEIDITLRIKKNLSTKIIINFEKNIHFMFVYKKKKKKNSQIKKNSLIFLWWKKFVNIKWDQKNFFSGYKPSYMTAGVIQDPILGVIIRPLTFNTSKRQIILDSGVRQGPVKFISSPPNIIM